MTSSKPDPTTETQHAQPLTDGSEGESIGEQLADIDPRAIKEDADGDREFFCDDCGARCTLGTDGWTEYGHRPGCSGRRKTSGTRRNKKQPASRE